MLAQELFVSLIQVGGWIHSRALVYGHRGDAGVDERCVDPAALAVSNGRMKASGIVLGVAALGMVGCASPAQKCANDRDKNLESCEIACENGDLPSCVSAARAYDQRYMKSGSVSDAERSVSMYEKSCLAGRKEACFGAVRGILLGPSESNPELSPPARVDRAAERRRVLLAKGCELDDPQFCKEASDAFLGEDAQRSEQLGRKYCVLELTDKGKRDACVMQREQRARQAQQGANRCASGQPGGCLALGNSVVTVDRVRAREAYARECKGRRLDVQGNADACVKVYESQGLATKLPAVEPSISDCRDARVILRSLRLIPESPSRPNPEQVREVVDRGTEALERCYAAGLRKNPKLAGSLTIRATIDGLGEIWNVQEDDIALIDLPTVECVKKEATTWRFPEPSQGTIQLEAKLAFRVERP